MKSFVVVVANNHSLTPGVAPLRFADDDGARWYERRGPVPFGSSRWTTDLTECTDGLQYSRLTPVPD